MHKQSLFFSLIDSVNLQGSDKIPLFAITMPVMKFSPSIILTKFIERANYFHKIKKKSWQKEIVNVQIQGVFFK